jgi:hypothetical protein
MDQRHLHLVAESQAGEQVSTLPGISLHIKELQLDAGAPHRAQPRARLSRAAQHATIRLAEPMQ